MNLYTMGFVLNSRMDKVLLCLKDKDEVKGWNGIGGKIEETDRSPSAAMSREAFEEAGIVASFLHRITYIGSFGVVYIFLTVFNGNFPDETDTGEPMSLFRIDSLPESVSNDIRWMLPLSMDSNIDFPVIIRGK